ARAATPNEMQDVRAMISSSNAELHRSRQVMNKRLQSGCTCASRGESPSWAASRGSLDHSCDRARAPQPFARSWRAERARHAGGENREVAALVVASLAAHRL